MHLLSLTAWQAGSEMLEECTGMADSKQTCHRHLLREGLDLNPSRVVLCAGLWRNQGGANTVLPHQMWRQEVVTATAALQVQLESRGFLSQEKEIVVLHVYH